MQYVQSTGKAGYGYAFGKGKAYANTDRGGLQYVQSTGKAGYGYAFGKGKAYANTDRGQG